MAKIKLGNRPKNFKRTVSFDMLDGTKGTIECIFKYRTRSEFGAFVDEMFDKSKDAEKDSDEIPKQLSMAELMDKTKDTNAILSNNYLTKCLLLLVQ